MSEPTEEKISPDLDSLVREYVEGELLARKRGITLELLYNSLQNHSNALMKHVEEERRARLKIIGRLDTHKDWFAKVFRFVKIHHPEAHREPMPSLSADDSGSIDLRVFGQRASFRGVVPIRIATAILIVGMTAGIIGAAGYGLRAATFHPSAPVAAERK